MEMCELNCIKKIYSHIQDEESRRIYMARLNYSLTSDYGFLKQMVDMTVRNTALWKNFISYLCERSQYRSMVIFGAGIWGNILYNETCKSVSWKYAVDSRPQGKAIDRLDIVDFQNFVESYDNEYVVISSYKNYDSMKEQLEKNNIPSENIIDAGSVIYEITERAIYFDLDEIIPSIEGETFIDAGCFDGLNTKQFFKWCKNNGKSYCFEPDKQNIALIKRNLEGYTDYEIVEGALWSEDTILAVEEKNNYATSVSEWDGLSETGKINAVSLDSKMKNMDVTFIKMDIEGAELNAIMGAKQIIMEKHPKLAISIYHKLEDIWEIPRLILEYYSDYKFYLRHYSFSDYDTVLYAV